MPGQNQISWQHLSKEKIHSLDVQLVTNGNLMKEDQTVVTIIIKAQPVFPQCIYPVIDTDRSDVRARHEGLVFEADQEASFTHPWISQQHHLDINTSEIRSRRADESCKYWIQTEDGFRKYCTKLGYLKLSARLLICAVDGRSSEVVIYIVDIIELDASFLEFGTKRTAPNLNKSVGRSIGLLLLYDWRILHCLRFQVATELSQCQHFICFVGI